MKLKKKVEVTHYCPKYNSKTRTLIDAKDEEGLFSIWNKSTAVKRTVTNRGWYLTLSINNKFKLI